MNVPELINLKVTLLSPEQVEGPEKLRVLKNFGAFCKTTDFAYVHGTLVKYTDSHGKNDPPLHAATYSLITESNFDKITCFSRFGTVEKYGMLGHYGNDSREFGVRPVIKFDNFFSIVQNAKLIIDKPFKANDVLEVELGEFPLYAPPTGWQKDLERDYAAGKLKKLDRKFTMATSVDDTEEEKIEDWDIYEFGESKYIRYIFKGRHLSDACGRRDIWKDEVIWIRISPIKWLVDFENQQLISKYVLFSGVEYEKDKTRMFIPFDETNMCKFLNNEFIQDAFYDHFKKEKEKEEVIRKEEEKTKVEKLLEEIYSIVNELPDPEFKERISSKVESCVGLFNDKADKIKKAKENNEPIIENLDAITSRLELELGIILEEAKDYSINKSKYYVLITRLEEYKDILNGKEAKSNDELSKDLQVIVNKIIPFLKEEDASNIKDILLSTINKEIKKIHDVILDEDKNKLDYPATLEDLELEIRKEIHPVLELLCMNVSKRDIEKEIKDAMNGIIMNLYKAPRYKLLAQIMGTINEYYKNINGLLAEFPEELKNTHVDDLNNIMNREINYDKSFAEIVGELQKMMSSLEVLQGNITKDITEYRKLETSHIDLSKYKRQESANVD